jgi:hypothetical protein
MTRLAHGAWRQCSSTKAAKTRGGVPLLWRSLLMFSSPPHRGGEFCLSPQKYMALEWQRILRGRRLMLVLLF